MSDSRRDEVFRGARAEASARLFFSRGCRNQRSNDGCAATHSPRTHEFFQILFKPGIRIADAFGILNDGFAVGEKSGHRECHGNAMISEAGEFGTAQWGRPVNRESV